MWTRKYVDICHFELTSIQPFSRFSYSARDEIFQVFDLEKCVFIVFSAWKRSVEAMAIQQMSRASSRHNESSIDGCKHSKKKNTQIESQQQVRWAVDGRRDNNFNEEEERKTKTKRSESWAAPRGWNIPFMVWELRIVRAALHQLRWDGWVNKRRRRKSLMLSRKIL